MFEISGIDNLEYSRERHGVKCRVEGTQLDNNAFSGSQRKRLYAWLTHVRKVVSHGSAVGFVQRFECCLQIREKVYYVVNAQERHRWSIMRAKPQGNFFPLAKDDQTFHVDLNYQVTFSMNKRLGEHRELMATKLRWVPVVEPQQMGPWNADIDQNVSFTSAGRTILSLVTHGFVTTLLNDDVMSAVEELMVQGQNVPLPEEKFDPLFPCCLLELFDA